MYRIFDLGRPLNPDELILFKELLNDCLDDNEYAIDTFQNIFGKYIYDFPIKVCKCNEEVAADFYCYCLDKGRIFKQLLSFEDLKECRLKTYQYTALKHLFAKWCRSDSSQNNHELSIDEFDDYIDDKALYYNEKEPVSNDSHIPTKKYNNTFKMLLDKVSGDKRVYLALLLFSEIELKVNDIKAISEFSKKRIKEVRQRLDNLAQEIKIRDEKYNKKIGHLLLVCSKICSLQNKIESLKGSTPVDRGKDIKILEKRLLKAKEQRDALRQQGNRSMVTYRDIANILGVSLGTVSSNINKIRKELRKTIERSLDE